tara:strand:- start:1176 stop:1418 length:243 start_codon:yes stop_codon:yes gene_type:complete
MFALSTIVVIIKTTTMEQYKMTNNQMIKQARQQLNTNNKEAYKRVMQSNLRSSMSSRSTNAFIKAIKEDGFSVTFKQEII